MSLYHDIGVFSTGLYCSGWAKTTPIGVLLRRMAFETAEALLHDLEEGYWHQLVQKPYALRVCCLFNNIIAT